MSDLAEISQRALAVLVALGPVVIWRFLVWLETRPLPGAYRHGRGWRF